MRRALPILTTTALVGLIGIGGAHAQETEPSPVITGSSTSVPSRAYDVSASGVTLPPDTSFPAFARVSYQATALDGTSPRTFGVDLVPEDGFPAARHIGSSTLRFDDARDAFPDGYCVVWVEVSMFDERFGEQAEDPECTVYPGVGVVNGVAASAPASSPGLSISGPAPLAGLLSILVTAAAAMIMVRHGSFQD